MSFGNEYMHFKYNSVLYNSISNRSFVLRRKTDETPTRSTLPHAVAPIRSIALKAIQILGRDLKYSMIVVYP